MLVWTYCVCVCCGYCVRCVCEYWVCLLCVGVCCMSVCCMCIVCVLHVCVHCGCVCAVCAHCVCARIAHSVNGCAPAVHQGSCKEAYFLNLTELTSL